MSVGLGELVPSSVLTLNTLSPVSTVEHRTSFCINTYAGRYHHDDHDTLRALRAIARAGTGLAAVAPTRSRTDPPQHHLPSVATYPPISFDHLLRRDNKGPDSSRRGSATPPQREDGEWWYQRQLQAQAEREARRRVKPEDGTKAKAENAKRDEELRRSLKQVEELGISSTRQFDDTYYTTLEKVSILRSPVASLQQLAEESKKIRGQFDEDTRKLEEDTTKTLEGFKNFEGQEGTIDELVEKLKTSKSDTEKLDERLESARKRVEAFERREREERSKRRKQWHATWGMLVGVIVLIVAILVFKHRRHLVEDHDLSRELAAGVAAVRMPTVLQAKPSPSENPYLSQLFDSL
ncbi:hypothetical protein LTS16_026349 [Friedmanniomyces endolithicus]|nr:hypothetical protein LTS01_025093 [Friedmanniomyces endolithicus]KAK1021652.1 hypothetical protein LTS16_026349 [Friedmanniomyces endolithicus]